MFNIGSQKDFFEQIVMPQHAEFLRDNANVRIAVGAIIFTYHLYEWAYGNKFSVDDFARRFPTDKLNEDNFELARQIANGAKHNLAIITRTQRGFSSAFSNAFARSLIVQKKDGSEISVDLLLQQLIGFWTEQDRLGWK